MRVVLLGAPGSGKGTQAELIVKNYAIDHISTGDLLRAEVAAGTPLGERAKQIMEAGKLVSDEIVLSMIEHHLTRDLTRPGFLLDGFPRNLSQAQALNELLDRVGQPLDVVLFFEVDYGEIMQRLLARKRADDTEDTIRKRLEVYEEQTAPLINYYKERGNLRIIDGIGDIDEISQRIARVLDEVK